MSSENGTYEARVKLFKKRILSSWRKKNLMEMYAHKLLSQIMFNARVRWKNKLLLSLCWNVRCFSFVFIFFSLYCGVSIRTELWPNRLRRQRDCHSWYSSCAQQYEMNRYSLYRENDWTDSLRRCASEHTQTKCERIDFKEKISRKNRRQTKWQMRYAFTLPYCNLLRNSSKTVSQEEWMRCVFLVWNVD